MNKQGNGNRKASQNAFEFKGMKSQPGDLGRESENEEESAGQFKGRSERRSVGRKGEGILAVRPEPLRTSFSTGP
jgi:hypothetical protein